jgi:hypothetical protein
VRYLATKNLLVRGGADFSGMKKAMENAQKSIQGFKESVSRSMRSINIVLAGLGAGLGIGSAVKDAMTFQASIEQVNRLMGQSAYEFLKWANTSAAAFNMSKKEAVQYGATFSNIISTFAQTTQQTQQYTQDLLKATAVAASKTGRTMEDALERVRSGMLGNTESIEDLGIFVNVAMIESTKAFQQFAGDKSWDQLDFKVQQQIRLFAILEQASTKYGVEVGNNAVSATARFVAQLNDLKLALGQAFLPIWETVLPSLTAFVGWLVKGMTAVAQFMQVLFGKDPAKSAQSQASANTQVASSVEGIGDAYKDAGKKAKKAQGSLAGFDEVNTLADKSTDTDSDGGTEPGGVGIPEIPTDTEGGIGAISSKIRDLAINVRDFFSNVKDFFVGLGGFISSNKDIIISALVGIGAGLATYVIATYGATVATKAVTLAQKAWNLIMLASTKLLNGLKAAWAFLTGPIGLVVAAVTLATAAFVYFYRTNETFRGVVDGILNQIKDAAIWLWQNALVPLGNYLATGFKAAWEGVKVAAEWVWKNVFVPLGEFLSNGFKMAWEGIQTAISTLGDVLGNLKDGFSSFSDKLVEIKDNAIQNTKDKFAEFKKGIEENETTIKAIATTLGVIFGPALIKTGIEAAIAGAKMAGSFILQMIRTGAVSITVFTQIYAGIISSMIKTGLETVKTSAILTGQFIVSLIKTGIETAKTAAVMTGQFIVSLIKTGIEGTKTAAIITGQLIVSTVNYAIEGWKAVAAITAQTTAWIANKVQVIASTTVLAAQRTATIVATAAQWAFNAALSANPIGIVILAIGALVAAGIALYKNWDDVKKFAGELWDSIKAAWDNIGKHTEKIWDGVKSHVKGVVNFLIGAINKMIDGINSLNFSVPEIDIPGVGKVGGFEIGLPKIPKIPALAKGGITNGPTLAMIGDNPGGREVVSPLDDLQDIIASAVGTAVTSAMQMGGGNNKGPVILNIDGTEIARVIGPYLNKEQNRIGGNMIITK